MMQRIGNTSFLKASFDLAGFDLASFDSSVLIH